LYADPPRQIAAFLKKWDFRTTHSPLAPLMDAARTVSRDWDGNKDPVKAKRGAGALLH
jgi:hypothetical protein